MSFSRKYIALSWTCTSASPRVQSGGSLLSSPSPSNSLFSVTFSSAPVSLFPSSLFAVTEAHALSRLFGFRRKLELLQHLLTGAKQHHPLPLLLHLSSSFAPAFSSSFPSTITSSPPAKVFFPDLLTTKPSPLPLSIASRS